MSSSHPTYDVKFSRLHYEVIRTSFTSFHRFAALSDDARLAIIPGAAAEEEEYHYLEFLGELLDSRSTRAMEEVRRVRWEVVASVPIVDEAVAERVRQVRFARYVMNQERGDEQIERIERLMGWIESRIKMLKVLTKAGCENVEIDYDGDDKRQEECITRSIERADLQIELGIVVSILESLVSPFLEEVVLHRRRVLAALEVGDGAS